MSTEKKNSEKQQRKMDLDIKSEEALLYLDKIDDVFSFADFKSFILNSPVTKLSTRAADFELIKKEISKFYSLVGSSINKKDFETHLYDVLAELAVKSSVDKKNYKAKVANLRKRRVLLYKPVNLKNLSYNNKPLLELLRFLFFCKNKSINKISNETIFNMIFNLCELLNIPASTDRIKSLWKNNKSNVDTSRADLLIDYEPS